MAHLESYDSFQTKKSKEQKARAKNKDKYSRKKSLESEKFVVKKGKENVGVVIETKYNEAIVLYKNSLIKAHMKRGLNMVCNQTIFPGDKVLVIYDENSGLVISNLVKRKNVLTRTKVDRTRNGANNGVTHIVAANIDIAIIVVSAKEPPLHSKFIDRYLMLLQNSSIKCAICLNKSDLKTQADEEILNIYRKIGFLVIETSAKKNEGIQELRNVIEGKQAIFVGHSGVGKSSLTNALMEYDEIKTSHVSVKSGKGRHTTTTSKYYVLDKRTSIIDTPGIRSLDLSDFGLSEIQEYFPEFEEWKLGCKYSNCLHYNEPTESCAVKQAVKSKKISVDRYESYVRILNDIEQR